MAQETSTPKMNVLNLSIANLAPKKMSTAHAVKVTLQRDGAKDCVAANSVQDSFVKGLAHALVYVSDEDLHAAWDIRHQILSEAEERKRAADAAADEPEET